MQFTHYTNVYVIFFRGKHFIFLFWWDQAGCHSTRVDAALPTRFTRWCDYYYCFLLKIRVFPITDSDAAGHKHVQHSSAVVSDAHTRRRLFGRRGSARDQKITEQDNDNNNYYIITWTLLFYLYIVSSPPNRVSTNIHHLYWLQTIFLFVHNYIGSISSLLLFLRSRGHNFHV